MQKATHNFGLTIAAIGFAQLALLATTSMSAATAEDRGGTQASKENVLENRNYNPIEAISYELGANKLSGYFRPLNGRCAMTLMLFKNIDPLAGTPDNSPSRIQVSVAPGENTRIDSAEGESVKLNCNSRAETVTALRFNQAKPVDISEYVDR